MSTESLLQQYNCTEGVWDEMLDRNQIREQYSKVFNMLQQLQVSDLHQKDILASELFMNQGITFTVYSDDAGIERIFPFDIIPRIITGKEWEHVENIFLLNETHLAIYLCKFRLAVCTQVFVTKTFYNLVITIITTYH